MISDVTTKLRGRIGYLLAAFVVLHFTYPLSELSQTASLIYVLSYCTVLGIGAYITSISRIRLITTVSMAVLSATTGMIWAVVSNDQVINWSLWIFYVTIILNLALMGLTIWEFIFSAKRITSDVLKAGIALYLVIGNFFTPLYLLLHSLSLTIAGQPGFGVHTFDPINGITWQRMYYLSFTVLTTLGFGDITPINSFMEPFVLAEAAIGVLYVAILMARLVSLYDSGQIDALAESIGQREEQLIQEETHN